MADRPPARGPAGKPTHPAQGRLRLRLARWLIYPHAKRVYEHYHAMAQHHRADGNGALEERCEYIGIGVLHVARHWPHEDGVGSTDRWMRSAKDSSEPAT